MVLDASVAASVVSFHLNVSADPWSYTSANPTPCCIPGEGGDVARVQYLFWGNTGYTVNQIVNTMQNGDTFALPEVKTKGNIVPAQSITSTYGNIFNIPAAKIDYSFFPIREAWVDIKPTDEIAFAYFSDGIWRPGLEFG